MRKNEDPRLSFSTPEFKEAQRIFTDAFKVSLCFASEGPPTGSWRGVGAPPTGAGVPVNQALLQDATTTTNKLSMNPLQ